MNPPSAPPRALAGGTMDLNSDLCPLVWGRAACSRSEQGTRPGPCCSWASPTGHGGGLVWGGNGRLQAGPWSCLGRGPRRGWVSPVPCLPLGQSPALPSSSMLL